MPATPGARWWAAWPWAAVGLVIVTAALVSPILTGPADIPGLAAVMLVTRLVLVKAVTSGILLTGGEVLKMQRGLPPATEQPAMYLFLAVVGATVLILYLRNLHDGQDAHVRQEALRPLSQPSA